MTTSTDVVRLPWRVSWLMLCAACAVAVAALPRDARADRDDRQGSSLRQAGSHGRYDGRSDHGYGKRYGDDRGRGYADRGRDRDYRDYRDYREHRGNPSRGDNDRYLRPAGQHYGQQYYGHYAQPHYGHAPPPVYRHSVYRPPVYYPHHHHPPAHIVRPPLPRYTTIHVSGYPFPYYYDAGVFYRPYGSNFWISVSAPIGARVYGLPAGYVTFGYGGQTYYRAHSTYYVYDRPASQYVVVEPPAGAPPAYAGATAPTEELFVYPARGQSEEATQRDRYECHVWSVSQVGMDPSLGGAGEQERADYRRALTACLEGRGYTVR